MTAFKLDEVVDVTIKGVRVARPRSATSVTITDEHGVAYQMPPQAKVERVAPAEWPPQPGDLWRTHDGDLYFAADVHDVEMTDEPEVVMVWTHQNYRVTPADLNRREGPLALVRREEPASVFCADSECGHHKQLHHGNQCVGGNANEDPCGCTHFQDGAES